MVTIQNYVRAQSIDEAYELNQKKGSCIIGGMLWTKMQDRLIQTAIDMCDLGLDKIEEKDDEFIIGAMASLRQIELHDGLNKYTHGAVCEAVKDIVGVQFRNLATIGGSIWGRFGFSDILTVFFSYGCICGTLSWWYDSSQGICQHEAGQGRDCTSDHQENSWGFCLCISPQSENRFSCHCLFSIMRGWRIPSGCGSKAWKGDACSG